jgi:DNA-binding NtrC family response regulator
MEALIGYGWPGNVRELINVVERAVLLCQANKIRLADLPEVMAQQGGRTLPAETFVATRNGEALPPHLLQLPLKQAREEITAAFEKHYLIGLLERTEGRIGPTARVAGITPRALYDKMKRYGLRKEDYKV